MGGGHVDDDDEGDEGETDEEGTTNMAAGQRTLGGVEGSGVYLY